ncbi:centromere protein T isoform X2 [Dromiciops gliroides]|uniref:centromere protein T isoform X2 n=1 Tax=Dromiciops gliroides TaxID=33562 RepID=UPI001CC71B93|nr:centromere protein T isoform X2 [Dromiciops gliroides]
MEFLSENDGTTRTLLHRVLELHPLSSPVSSNTRLSKRSLSSSVKRPRRNLRDTLTGSDLSKQTKTASAQPKDAGANGQLYDFLEEGTPRILLKKILQTASEASVLMPALVNSQEPEPVQSQEESKWNSLDLQDPEPEHSVTVAPRLLVHSRKKRCLRVSEFEQEVDQGLALASSDLTGEQPASANKSSVTRSFNLTLATVVPPESVEKPGLARRPRTRKTVDVKAFEQGLKDIPPTHRLPCPGRPTKSYTKRPSQNTPLSTSSTSTGKRSRTWAGTPGHNSRLSAPSGPAGSSIFREARDEAAVARQGEEEEEESGMDDEAKEPEEDTEILQRTASESSMETPEFLRAKRNERRSRPTSPAPPITNTTLLPAKPTQAKHAPKRRAPRPRQPCDPDKASLKNYCNVFSYYAKIPMEKSASETLVKCLDQYFRTLCDDLETFAHHAGRKTVLLDDLELLMRRQGLVTDDVSLYVLVERYLPLEYRRLLIPCAASGNSVFPDG